MHDTAKKKISLTTIKGIIIHALKRENDNIEDVKIISKDGGYCDKWIGNNHFNPHTTVANDVKYKLEDNGDDTYLLKIVFNNQYTFDYILSGYKNNPNIFNITIDGQDIGYFIVVIFKEINL